MVHLPGRFIHMIRLKANGVGMLLLCLAWWLTGCFTLREPDLPTATTSWNTPTEPDVLLDNFRLAITELNVVNYERCLKPELFRFTADPTISGQSVGIFQRWTIQEELEYVKNINAKRAAVGNNRLQFVGARRNFLTADSLEITSGYQLSVYHTDTSFSQFQYEGNMIMTLVRGRNNEWSIRSWQDTKTGTLPCWTELKAYFVVPR